VEKESGSRKNKSKDQRKQIKKDRKIAEGLQEELERPTILPSKHQKSGTVDSPVPTGEELKQERRKMLSKVKSTLYEMDELTNYLELKSSDVTKFEHELEERVEVLTAEYLKKVVSNAANYKRLQA